MRKINITLPKSYSQCSLAQLRAISSIIIGRAQDASPLRPFDVDDVKTAMFFRLANIEISGYYGYENVDERYYLCRFRPYTIEDELHYFRCVWKRFKAWARKKIKKEDDTFPLYLWQLNYFLYGKKSEKGNTLVQGKLDWIDTNSRSLLLIFPFADFHKRHVKFQGPAPLMDGFTWQRYRLAQDFMQCYADLQNSMLQNQKSNRHLSVKATKDANRKIDEAQARFLAVIFMRKRWFVDSKSGLKRYDYCYHKEQYARLSRYFRNFPAEDWQIVLIWWQSMMHYLARNYPRVFKKQKLKGGKRKVNPLELYSRTTATIEKHLGINAGSLDEEPYTVVLQHLEDIMLHNEQMDRINKKSK